MWKIQIEKLRQEMFFKDFLSAWNFKAYTAYNGILTFAQENS